MKILPFYPIFPDERLISSADTFFGSIKEEYVEYKKRGMFNQHDKSCFLLYNMKGPDFEFSGIIVSVPIDAYRNGSIKKHEGTLAVSEQKQLQLLIKREAAVKPVLLTYNAIDNIEDFIADQIEKNNASFVIKDKDDVVHSIYEVLEASKEAKVLEKLFCDNIDALYIADGHHRSSVTEILSKQREENGSKQVPLLSAIFSNKQLRIQAYHRIVELQPELSKVSLMVKMSRLFDIEILEQPKAPNQKGELTMFVDGECYLLKWKPEIIEKAELNLDPGLFNDLVADPIFEIKDVRTNARITYVPGNKGVQGVLNKCNKRSTRIGFMLYGIEAQEMFDVVNNGHIMPPKSTWFQPRLKNGLVVMEI